MPPSLWSTLRRLWHIRCLRHALQLIVVVQTQEKLQLQIEIKECIDRSLVVAVLAANNLSPWMYLAPRRTS